MPRMGSWLARGGVALAVFGTAAIGYEAWLLVLPFAVAMLAFDEARKAFVRWQER